MIRRVGILTGGGDCPGLNAVIRAVVKGASSAGVETVGIADGFCGLVENGVRPLTNEDVSGILPRGGTILGTTNRDDPFHYRLAGSDGEMRFADRSDDVLATLRANRLDGLVVIGGDGTLTIAKKIGELGVPVVGVPKTIDNDLAATDVTFGFDSALAVATEAVDRLHTTAESHHRVMILEVMGRHAGWIALRSGIAGGGDILILPEIPYEIAGICAAIDARRERGRRFSIVVAAEGARDRSGHAVYQREVPGSPERRRLGGIGHALAGEIEECTGVETRVTVLGHLQRGGTPTAFDRWLATRFGAVALRLLCGGSNAHMVALHGTEIVSVPLGDAVDRLRRVDPDGEEVATARSVGTSFGDER